MQMEEPLSTFPQLEPAVLQQEVAGEKDGDLFFYPNPIPYLCILNNIHMKENIIEIQETVSKDTSEFLEQYWESTGVPFTIMRDQEAKEHVIRIGTAIMMNRFGFNTNPGSFVQAVLNNDLSGAFNRADSINQKCLRFYVTLIQTVHSLEVKGKKYYSK